MGVLAEAVERMLAPRTGNQSLAKAQTSLLQGVLSKWKANIETGLLPHEARGREEQEAVGDGRIEKLKRHYEGPPLSPSKRPEMEARTELQQWAPPEYTPREQQQHYQPQQPQQPQQAGEWRNLSPFGRLPQPASPPGLGVPPLSFFGAASPSAVPGGRVLQAWRPFHPSEGASPPAGSGTPGRTPPRRKAGLSSHPP